MMEIRSDGSIIETVITENGNDPMVEKLTLDARAGEDQWACFVVILDPQGGRRIRPARVVRLELDLEVDE